MMDEGICDSLETDGNPIVNVGTHKHKCHFCGWVWEHADSCDIKHGDEGFHECARCGRCNWEMGIYTGDEPPSKPYRV